MLHDAPDDDPLGNALDEIEVKIATTTALTLDGIAAQIRLAHKEQDYSAASLGTIEVQGLQSALASLEALRKPEAPDLS